MSVLTKRLSEIAVGKYAIIDSFTDDYLKLKLLEMGCLPGEKILVERLAPFGNPMAINVSDSTISIRTEEAYNVIVLPFD